MTTTSIYTSTGKYIDMTTVNGTTKSAAKAAADALAARLGVEYAYFTITDNRRHTSRHYTIEGKPTTDLIK